MKINRAGTAALAVLSAAAIFGASFAGVRVGMGARSGTEKAAEPKSESRYIEMPGYDVLRLSAQQKEQQVYFYNPAENECFIEISLSLDGKELYASELIPPNTKIEQIDIAEPLEPGSYDGSIRYSCYDLYTQRELNGAEIAVELEVER